MDAESIDECSRENDSDYNNCKEQALLFDEFLGTIRGLDVDGSWMRAYEAGKPYREFAESLAFFIGVWGRFGRGKWVDSVLRWLREHPGVDVPNNVEFIYPDLQDTLQESEGVDRNSRL